MQQSLTEAQWLSYDTLGYLILQDVLSGSTLQSLSTEIDEIMLGTADIDYEGLLMQLDSDTGRYEDAGEQSLGHKGATLGYRKIQNLELDPLFREYLEQPLFAEISKKVYGNDVPIACFRAMFMNKPARHGTLLPWHQDAWVYLDRQPLITAWTALDPATKENGCVQIIPGSHKAGRLNPDHYSGYLTPEQVAEHCEEEKIIYIELKAGDVVLLHNFLLHRSDTNFTDVPRRAFSVCYMDARTVVSNDEKFTPLF